MRTNLLAAVAVTLLIGCGADPIPASRIHIVGDYGSWNTAFHWSEAGLSILDEPDGNFHALATSVAVAGETVFVGGSYNDRPCYWEDGVRRDLDCDTGEIVEVAVNDAGELILAGTCGEEASVWADGVRAALPVPAGRVGNVRALAVVDNTVYVAGNHRAEDWSSETPCTWRDGELSELQPPSRLLPGGSVRVSGIAVSDQVYVSASYDADDGGAGYWSGNTWTEIDGATARDIAADGSSVFIAGRDSDGACYWKDGDKTALQCEFSTIATAIAASGGAVVVAGKCGATSQPDHIGYWADSDFVQIHEQSVADINGIFIAD